MNKEDKNITEDAYLPDPSKPWCRVCRKHSDYYIKNIPTGTVDRHYHFCKVCDKEMNIPNQTSGLGILYFQLIIGMTFFCFVPMGNFSGELQNTGTSIVVFIIIIVGLLVGIPIYNYWENFYLEWRTWALSKSNKTKPLPSFSNGLKWIKIIKCVVIFYVIIGINEIFEIFIHFFVIVIGFIVIGFFTKNEKFNIKYNQANLVALGIWPFYILFLISARPDYNFIWILMTSGSYIMYSMLIGTVVSYLILKKLNK